MRGANIRRLLRRYLLGPRRSDVMTALAGGEKDTLTLFDELGPLVYSVLHQLADEGKLIVRSEPGGRERNYNQRSFYRVAGTCRGCGCLLATFLGGLEEHKPTCPNFPL